MTQLTEENKKINTIQELETQQQKILKNSQFVQPKKLAESKVFTTARGDLADLEW